jgi:hypothetical protein
MTHEEISVCTNARLPKGYVMTYHELRGYDSPDKWFEAKYRGRKITEGGREDVVTFCVQHNIRLKAKKRRAK